MNIGDLPTPALVIDSERLASNIQRMADRCQELSVSLRPHVKSHKSPDLARLQLAAGNSRGITTSTLAETRAFLEAGFDDVTWAMPVAPSRLVEVETLASRMTLNVLVDSIEAVTHLGRAGFEVGVFIKVDCGYHRAGVAPASNELLAVADELAGYPQLSFAGLLTHAGHAYSCRNGQGIAEIAEEERLSLTRSAEYLGVTVDTLSVGSTPTALHARTMDGVDEVRAGNYPFFDYMQYRIGSCQLRDCALSVATTVVSSSVDRDTCVIDAGALSLSKDVGPDGNYGRFWEEYSVGTLSPHFITGISQEHGMVNRCLPVGTRHRLLPNHACLAAASFDAVHVADGDQIVDTWSIRREH